MKKATGCTRISSICPVTGRAIFLYFITMAQFLADRAPRAKDGSPAADPDFSCSVNYGNWGGRRA